MDGLIAFHIVWVTHNSRISEKLVSFGVKKKHPVILNDDMRNRVAADLEQKIRTAEYRVICLNVLRDHVHCVIVSSESEIDDTVGQLKGYTSYMLKRKPGPQLHDGAAPSLQGYTSPGNGATSAPRRATSPDNGAASAPREKIGPHMGNAGGDKAPSVKSKQIWAKKFSKTYIHSEDALARTIEYVENNHFKHDVPPLRTLFSNWADKNADTFKGSPVAVSVTDAFNTAVVLPRHPGGGLKTAVATPVEGDAVDTSVSPRGVTGPGNGAASAPRRVTSLNNGAASAPRNV